MPLILIGRPKRLGMDAFLNTPPRGPACAHSPAQDDKLRVSKELKEAMGASETVRTGGADGAQ